MSLSDDFNIPVLVDKLGGTSISTPERFENAITVALREKDRECRRIIVVSALGGVTDQLIKTIDEALSRSGKHGTLVEDIISRHKDLLAAVARPEEVSSVLAELDDVWRELQELLDGVYLLRECTPRSRDAVLSIGERAAVPIFAAALRAHGHRTRTYDAREFIITDERYGNAGVLFEEWKPRVREASADASPDEVGVVTGFIGTTPRAVITTLGRSGSDYTATVIGSILDAEQVVIWTDVDGVLSADPQLVPEAFTLPELSYREAAELAYFGAKVLHPRTMRPLQVKKIPLLIRNTMRPESSGTRISADVSQRDGHVKAVTSIRNVAVVMLEGTGLMGVQGISALAFGALASLGINIYMISQASSEQSLCAVVSNRDAEAAVQAVQEVFQWELSRGDVSRVYARNGAAVLSVVGDNMRERPGLAGLMFSTLARNGVNILAIAQGASETNISTVVWDRDVRQAVRALHETFALSHAVAHIFLIGTGVVGKALLSILEEIAPTVRKEQGIRLKLVGAANSRRMVWEPDGIGFTEVLERLPNGEETDLDDVMDRLKGKHLERLIVVDATASAEVAHGYPELIDHHVAVVTPNKRSNTLDQAFYDRLHELARRNRVPYLYETTVGAGLPVISTLRDLLRSGDTILRIEGVFSGTLAFLFNQLSLGHKFSEIVREARHLGFTEPDPRDDLKGEDVVRKLLILGREMGLRVERADVAVESLVPPDFLEVSVEEYLELIDQEDEAWAKRVAKAAEKGGRLQYIGTIEDGRLSVRVRTVDAGSPFAHLTGTNCMFLYRTKRYDEPPLIVQGPGAGPAVTAAGMVADVLKAVEISR